MRAEQPRTVPWSHEPHLVYPDSHLAYEEARWTLIPHFTDDKMEVHGSQGHADSREPDYSTQMLPLELANTRSLASRQLLNSKPALHLYLHLSKVPEILFLGGLSEFHLFKL